MQSFPSPTTKSNGLDWPRNKAFSSYSSHIISRRRLWRNAGSSSANSSTPHQISTVGSPLLWQNIVVPTSTAHPSSDVAINELVFCAENFILYQGAYFYPAQPIRILIYYCVKTLVDKSEILPEIFCWNVVEEDDKNLRR